MRSKDELNKPSQRNYNLQSNARRARELQRNNEQRMRKAIALQEVILCVYTATFKSLHRKYVQFQFMHTQTNAVKSNTVMENPWGNFSKSLLLQIRHL